MTGEERREKGSGASRDRGAPQRRSAVGGGFSRAVWVVGQVRARFARDGCSLMAAATAFYGLISLIPLGVLAISVVGRVLGFFAAADAEGQVLDFMRAALPLKAPAVERAIRQYPHPTGSWFVEAVSLLGLVWAGSRLFRTLEEVLTRVWSGHGRGRSLFARYLIALAATVCAGLIFLATMLATATTAALASTENGLPAALILRWVAPGLRAVAPIGAAWMMFLLMYKFLPQERVRWREAVIGAAAAAVMWEISRTAFAILVSQSAGYGQLYGSLAGIVLVGMWIYVTAAIMLVGAELAVVLQLQKQAVEE